MRSLLDRIRDGSYVAEDRVLAVPGRAVSLSLVAERILQGEPALAAVREFLDGAGRAAPETLEQLVADEPAHTGEPCLDALLGGVAEYTAVTRGFRCPGWAQAPDRFLGRFWFVSDVPGFRAVAIAHTPVSLKRRGIFWPERSLERV